MSDTSAMEITRVVDSIFSEGDLLATAKVVEIAVMLSEKKDTQTITKNIDNVVHYMEQAIRKLGNVKRANR